MYALVCKLFKMAVVLLGLSLPFVGLSFFARPFRSQKPRYLFEVDVKPVFENDWRKLVQLLDVLAKEAGISIVEGEQKIFLQAMTEPQVETVIAKLRDEYRMEIALGEPEIFCLYRGFLSKGVPLLWEPVMEVKVSGPKVLSHKIENALRNRRGRIIQIAPRGSDGCLVRAYVPLENMFGYSDTLASLSQEKASYTIAFDHFIPLPPDDEPPKRPAVIMR
ncbi:MAG: hypothetical protein ACAH83_08345 [Alphaproteobacteria bacterium]